MGKKRGSGSNSGANGKSGNKGQQRSQAQQKGRGQQKGRFAQTGEFLRSVRGELRKVSWPDRSQLRQSTAVVLIVVATLGVYVAIWDVIFRNLTNLIFF